MFDIHLVPTQTPQQIVVQPLNATALTVYWDPIPNSKTVTGGELSGFHVSLQMLVVL